MRSCPRCCRQPEILHTTLARVLKPPAGGGGGATVQRAVAAMSVELCGTETTLHEIWCSSLAHFLFPTRSLLACLLAQCTTGILPRRAAA